MGYKIKLLNVGIGTTGPGAKLNVQGGDINTSGKIKEGGNALIPTGAVMFFNLAACPTGWTEVTAARGMYIVGLPAAGTLAGTSGTALTNLESRAVGQHNHAITDGGHMHSVTNYGDSDSGAGPLIALMKSGTTVNPFPTNTKTSNISINNAGAVVGTNAPYIQLLVCQKN